MITGNTGIDALRKRLRENFTHPLLDWAEGSRLLLLTAHRRENRGAPMEQMFRGIRRVVEEFSSVKLIFPVHPHPGIRELAEGILGGCERIRLVEPMSVSEFQNIMARCHLILTDSGGIQEEAPYLHKPVLVLRKETERMEGVEAGTSRLIGTAEGAVYRGIRELLENDALYCAMSRGKNPYGDGYAGQRIAKALEKQYSGI
jgi:UDP-N-acetylglucosamine 2-epimerase (non-hydrolysing)